MQIGGDHRGIVQARLRQDGIAQHGAVETGIAQIGRLIGIAGLQIGPGPQISLVEIGLGQLRPAQARALQIGAKQIGLGQIAILEIDAEQIGIADVGADQQAAAEIGAGCPCVAQHHMVEVEARHIGMADIGPNAADAAFEKVEVMAEQFVEIPYGSLRAAIGLQR